MARDFSPRVNFQCRLSYSVCTASVSNCMHQHLCHAQCLLPVMQHYSNTVHVYTPHRTLKDFSNPFREIPCGCSFPKWECWKTEEECFSLNENKSDRQMQVELVRKSQGHKRPPRPASYQDPLDFKLSFPCNCVNDASPQISLP